MTPAAPGRKSVFDSLEVIVDKDFPVDVGRMGNMLVLKEGQTHENAVEQLVRLFPDAHVDDVTQAVRKAMPHAPSLDNLALQIGASTPKWLVGATEPAAPLMSKKRLQTIGCIVTVGLLAAGLGTYAALDRAVASPFETTGFLAAAEKADFHCDLQTSTTAECRYTGSNAMWEVTAHEGVVAGDPVSFRLWHDADIGVLWIFDSVEHRQSFRRLPAYVKLYPFITTHDRFIVAGTDKLVANNLATAVDATMVRHANAPGLQTPPEQRGWASPGAVFPTGVATLMPWPTRGAADQPQDGAGQRAGGEVAEEAPRGGTRPSTAPAGPETVTPSAAVTGTPTPGPTAGPTAGLTRSTPTPAKPTATRRPTSTPATTRARKPDLSVTITVPNLFAAF